jgi:hypothetical protein
LLEFESTGYCEISAFQALSAGKTVQLPIVGRAAAVVGADDGAALGLAVAGDVGDGAGDAEAPDDGEAVGVDVRPGLGDAVGGAALGPGLAGVPPPPEHPASTAATSTIGDFRIPWVRRGRRTF